MEPNLIRTITEFAELQKRNSLIGISNRPQPRIVENGVAYEAGGDRCPIRERFRRGHVRTHFVDEAVGSVVGLRAEEAGHHHSGLERFAAGGCPFCRGTGN